MSLVIKDQNDWRVSGVSGRATLTDTVSTFSILCRPTNVERLLFWCFYFIIYFYQTFHLPDCAAAVHQMHTRGSMLGQTLLFHTVIPPGHSSTNF